MKVNISKEWMQANAAKEEGMEIGAGSPPRSMDEAAMREQFEAWVAKVSTVSPANLRRYPESHFDWPGDYEHFPTQLAWEAWKAASKAKET